MRNFEKKPSVLFIQSDIISIYHTRVQMSCYGKKKNDRRLEHEEREVERKNVSFNIARYEVIEKVFNSTEMTITESVCCQINIFASSCSLLKKKRCKKRTQHTYCMPCHMAYIVVAWHFAIWKIGKNTINVSADMRNWRKWTKKKHTHTVQTDIDNRVINSCIWSYTMSVEQNVQWQWQRVQDTHCKRPVTYRHDRKQQCSRARRKLHKCPIHSKRKQFQKLISIKRSVRILHTAAHKCWELQEIPIRHHCHCGAVPL